MSDSLYKERKAPEILLKRGTRVTARDGSPWRFVGYYYSTVSTGLRFIPMAGHRFYGADFAYRAVHKETLIRMFPDIMSHAEETSAKDNRSRSMLIMMFESARNHLSRKTLALRAANVRLRNQEETIRRLHEERAELMTVSLRAVEIYMNLSITACAVAGLSPTQIEQIMTQTQKKATAEGEI